MGDMLSTKKNKLRMEFATFMYTMCFLFKIFYKVQQENKLTTWISLLRSEHHSHKAIGKFCTYIRRDNNLEVPLVNLRPPNNSILAAIRVQMKFWSWIKVKPVRLAICFCYPTSFLVPFSCSSISKAKETDGFSKGMGGSVNEGKWRGREVKELRVIITMTHRISDRLQQSQT